MSHRFRISLSLVLLIAVLAPGAAAPHRGGLDAYGCPHDRKQGGYHCHQGSLAGQAFASQVETAASRQQSYTAIPPTLPMLQFSGKVVGVKDGDSIVVLHEGRGEEIRLHGIDCPEKGQSFGNRAKQFTSQLVFGKEITVKSFGQDKYGRTIADVMLPDGRNLNHELVGAGLCWWYRKYAPHDKELVWLEVEAREAKRGLWADPNPIPPWEWRKR